MGGFAICNGPLTPGIGKGWSVKEDKTRKPQMLTLSEIGVVLIGLMTVKINVQPAVSHA
jgi:hypothetical protein